MSREQRLRSTIIEYGIRDVYRKVVGRKSLTMALNWKTRGKVLGKQPTGGGPSSRELPGTADKVKYSGRPAIRPNGSGGGTRAPLRKSKARRINIIPSTGFIVIKKQELFLFFLIYCKTNRVPPRSCPRNLFPSPPPKDDAISEQFVCTYREPRSVENAIHTDK